MVPSTFNVKMLNVQSQSEKDTSSPNLSFKSREDRKKTEEKKRKDQNEHESRKKQGTSVKMRKADENFLALLRDQQNEFLASEAKRWEEEKALEEKMRKEERQYEMALFSMFAGIFQGQNISSNQTFPSTSSAQSHSNSKVPSSQHSSFNSSFAPVASGSNTGSSMSFTRMLNEDLLTLYFNIKVDWVSFSALLLLECFKILIELSNH